MTPRSDLLGALGSLPFVVMLAGCPEEKVVPPTHSTGGSVNIFPVAGTTSKPMEISAARQTSIAAERANGVCFGSPDFALDSQKGVAVDCHKGSTYGLVWELAPTLGAFTAMQADEHCKQLTLQNMKWRLPTSDELESTTRSIIFAPNTDYSYLPGTGADSFWTSTRGNGPGAFRYVDFSSGNVHEVNGSATNRVICSAYVMTTDR